MKDRGTKGHHELSEQEKIKARVTQGTVAYYAASGLYEVGSFCTVGRENWKSL